MCSKKKLKVCNADYAYIVSLVLINASRDERHEKGTRGFIKGKVTLTVFPEFSRNFRDSRNFREFLRISGGKFGGFFEVSGCNRV